MINLKKIKKVLTFFAHPDDETLAAGGTIKKLTDQGVEVHVAIPATGITSRRNIQNNKSLDSELFNLRQDTEKALAILGVTPKNIHLGNFPDNEMDKHSLLELIHWLEAIIDDVKPDLIFTHHRYCTNIDHQYCHNAAIVATRPGLNNHITLVSCEVPSSTGYLKPAQWEPNFFVEVTNSNLESKILAMESFSGEARPDPHPRSREVLSALAKLRGSDSGFYFAESFMISKTFG